MTKKSKDIIFEDLSKLSDEELADRLEKLEAEIFSEEEKLEKIKARTKAIREDTARKELELEEIKKENERLLKARGWWGITDEEFAWLRENESKYWHFFRPTLQSIKEKFAEVHKTKVDTTHIEKFEKHPTFSTPNGWVERSGKFHPVRGFAEHAAWAQRYLENKHGILEAQELRKTENRKLEFDEILERQGWIRIMKWPDLDIKFILPSKISKAQRRTIENFCITWEIDFPFDD